MINKSPIQRGAQAPPPSTDPIQESLATRCDDLYLRLSCLNRRLEEVRFKLFADECLQKDVPTLPDAHPVAPILVNVGNAQQEAACAHRQVDDILGRL